MDNKEIQKMIVEAQDKIVYFGTNSFEENISSEKINNSIISYRDAMRLIEEDDNLLNAMSTENLISIFSRLQVGSEPQRKIEDILMERFKKGDNLFAGNNIEITLMGNSIYTWNKAFSKFNTENKNNIKQTILTKLQKLKETNKDYYEMIAKSDSIFETSNFLEYHEKGIFTKENIAMIKNINSLEKDIIKQINFGLFQEDVTVLGEDIVKHIAKYPNLSAKFMIINSNNKELYKILADEINNIKDSSSLSVLYEELDRIINYFSRHYDEIKNIDNSKELINCAIQNGKKINKSDKLILEWQNNYQKKFDELCDREFEKTISKEKDVNDISDNELMKTLIELSKKELKVNKLNIIFNKYFSLSYKEVEDLINSYGKDLKNVQSYSENRKEIDFINELKRIFNIDDIQKLNNLYNTYSNRLSSKEVLGLEGKLRKIYALSYVESLQDTQSNIKFLQKSNSIKVKKIAYNGKNIPIIKINGVFSLLVHSSDTGFKGSKELINDSYKETWNNIQDNSNHLIATSYINEDFLGSAPVGENGVLYGFTNISPEYINLMGNSDINSHVRNSNYASGRSLYMSSKNMPYFSRRVYNEIAIERENTKPDYIIVYNDMNDRQKENAYNSASEFNIPILYINKKEIAEQQIENLVELMEVFQSTDSIEVLGEIISTYETNRAGWLLNRRENVEDNSFTSQIQNNEFKGMFNSIGEKINGMILNYKQKLTEANDSKKLYQLNKIIEKEKMLYENQNEQRTPISKTQISDYIGADITLDDIKTEEKRLEKTTLLKVIEENKEGTRDE